MERFESVYTHILYTEMEEIELGCGCGATEWGSAVSRLGLCEVDHLERGGVHIQCVESRDFVVGRQTNFNGPVTIINCKDVLKKGKFFEEGGDSREGGVIIQEEIMSPSAAAEVQKIATSRGTVKEGRRTDHRTLKKCQWQWRRKAVFFVYLAVLGAFALASAVFIVATEGSSPPRKCTQLADNVCLFSEFEWGGRPNSSEVPLLALPVTHLLVSQTDSNGYCYDYDACLDALRLLQCDRPADAACNFFLGGEGNVYEDRGWRHQSVPHRPFTGLLLCFMGDFVIDFPTYPQVQAAEALLRYGVEQGHVAQDYAVFPVNASAPILQIIKKWSGFREELPPPPPRPRRRADKDSAA